MRFSVLHISDLHRDPLDEVGNDALLDSIEIDLQRASQQTPSILVPTICVVTGDMIHGVNAGTPAYEVELRRQYAQASELLVGLANRFLGGRRERVVILPGNHDVCFEDVASSMSPIPTPADKDGRRRLVSQLTQPSSGVRWSWSDLQFFRISDWPRYHGRFRFFAEFYESFYEGRRKFSSDPELQTDVFDFPEERFSVITLNSCFYNDSLRRNAAVNPSSVIAACRKLREVPRSGWTGAVAWHHNLSALPGQDDFLHSAFAQSLIDAGAAIAFHGHQHMTDCFDEVYRLGPSPRRMTIISASTLCAEPKHLVAGVPRSYNVIEIDNDEMTGRVHQRRMVNLQMNLPVWGAGQFVATGTPFFDFSIAAPLRSQAAIAWTQVIDRVDGLLGSGDFSNALIAIQPIRELEMSRPFLSAIVEGIGDSSLVVQELWPPQSVREIVLVAGAILELQSSELALRFSQLELGAFAADASVRELSEKIRRLVR